MSSSKGEQHMALSLHQPWASLLAYGIMRGEGRVWTSDFKGKLWICATVKKPTDEEIKHYEDKFRDVYASCGYECPDFPEHYPTAAVIGRVTLKGILSQDDLQKQVEEGKLDPVYGAC